MEGLSTLLAFLAVVFANAPEVKVLTIGTDAAVVCIRESRGGGEEEKRRRRVGGIMDLRSFKVISFLHDCSDIFQCPPFLDVQPGDGSAVFAPRLGHHCCCFPRLMLFCTRPRGRVIVKLASSSLVLFFSF